jgi:hypothetical protein
VACEEESADIAARLFVVHENGLPFAVLLESLGVECRAYGRRREISQRAEDSDTHRAAHVHRWGVVRGLAFYDWILTPRFLERSARHHLVAVLSRRPLQCARAMTPGLFSGISRRTTFHLAPDWHQVEGTYAVLFRFTDRHTIRTAAVGISAAC